jgi:PAS domain S-box-containing protein
LVVDVLFFVGYFLLNQPGVPQTTQDYWAITPLVLIVAGIHAAFTVLVYPFLRKKTEWVAFVIDAVLFGIVLAAVIETSGNVNLVYRALFIGHVFMSNMVGPYIVIAGVALAWILLIFDFVSISSSRPDARMLNIVVDIALTVFGFLGWLVFRHHFEMDQSVKDAAAGLAKGEITKEKVKTDFILGSMVSGVIMLDPEGTIQYMNPAAAQLSGWDPHDALGLNYDAVLKFYDKTGNEYPKEKSPLQRAVQTQKPVRDNDIMYRTKSGKELSLTVDAAPLIDSNGAQTGGIICIFRDVSQERREEQQRAEFISTASHEMRTPVAAIEGYLALAMNDKVCLIDEKARGYLEKAHASTQHLGQLFQDLLTSAKADDGRLASHPEVVEFGTYLEKLIEDLRFTAEKKGIGMQFVVGSDQDNLAANSKGGKVIKPLYYVAVDPDRIREVITNLFDNAVKYTPSGTITIGLTGNNDVVQFYIKDTGGGIPPEDVPHLFQKFYRVDNTATRTIGGTGLGLFICRKIVELYSGRIWVKSRVGEGSTFFVNLPRLDATAAEQERLRLGATTTPVPVTTAAPKATVVQ